MQSSRSTVFISVGRTTSSFSKISGMRWKSFSAKPSKQPNYKERFLKNVAVPEKKIFRSPVLSPELSPNEEVSIYIFSVKVSYSRHIFQLRLELLLSRV